MRRVRSRGARAPVRVERPWWFKVVAVYCSLGRPESLAPAPALPRGTGWLDVGLPGIGYVPVDGHLAMAGPGDEWLEDPEVGRLFLGG